MAVMIVTQGVGFERFALAHMGGRNIRDTANVLHTIGL